MSVTDELYDLINEATTDTAAGRIFFPEPPENYNYAGPYIVFKGVGDQSQEGLVGSIGLAMERFEFSCRAKLVDGGNKTCRAMAEEVRLALQGPATPGGLLYNCSHVSRLDLYDFDLNLHVVPTDFEVSYAEPIPD